MFTGEIQSRSQPKFAARLRQPRRRLTIATTLLLCGLCAVPNGAEPFDSGWSISTPPPMATGTKHPHPQHELTLRQVLDQPQKPLLSRPPAPPAAAETNTGSNPGSAGRGSLHFAVRPDGIEGWRPAGPIIHSPGLTWQAQSSKSTSAAPSTAPAHDAEAAELAAPETGSDESEDGSGESSFGAMLQRVTNGAPTSPSAQPSAKPPSAPTDVDDSRPTGEEDVGPISIDELEDAATTLSAPPPLTKQLVGLRSRVRSVLKGYYRRMLNSGDHDPWEVMHGMLAYGVHSRIRQGGERGAPVTTVGWLCYNKPCKGLTLMYVTPKGELRAKYGVGLQGHLGQLLAMLAQCRVSEDYPIRVGKRDFTIRDLIEAEKRTCYPKSELTFKLLAFQYYLDLDDEWVNDQGLEWNIPRVIREELAQPIRGAACGGTHRLSSLSLTVKARLRRGEPLDGEYARAAEFVQKYHKYAFRLQNRDGSLSTAWFRGRGDDSDINRRIKTTGHILEWLCYSLSDEELRQPQTIAAVNYLSNLMYTKYDTEWEVGPMCHAIHALLVYDERVFQPFDGQNQELAYKGKRRTGTATARRPQWSAMRR
jgi:hypothetical protein